jgi:gluconokinase
MAKRALAIDLGSSSVRAIVFETSGPGSVAAVGGAIARRPRHLRTEVPGQATFDADDYLADLVACLDELHERGCLEGVGDVGTGSQWHSVLPIDSRGEPMGELVSWADTRPRRPPGGLQLGPAASEQLRQRTGCALAPMYWTWRAPWLSDALSDGLSGPPSKARGARRAGARGGPARLVGLAEYVGLKLLGDPSMSVSMASGTGLLATAAHTWDEEALEVAGLARSPGVLPPLAPPGWQGRLSEGWRRRWPALATAVWHPVLGDGAAANLGAGCEGPGRAALTVGTSAAVRALRAAPDASPLPAGLWRYCVDRDRVVLGAAYSSGGQLYSWALSLWEGTAAGSPAVATGETGTAVGASRELRYDVPLPVGAGSDGVLVLPWHAGTRPPAPGVPGGRGCVLGLGLGHTGANIASAAVEAVCFQLAGGLGDLEAGRAVPLDLVANGGAIDRSRLWKQRLASVIGRPVHCPAVPETTALGAAAMALGTVVSETGGEVVEPVGADVAVLARARRRWAQWYEALLPIAARGPMGGKD